MTSKIRCGSKKKFIGSQKTTQKRDSDSSMDDELKNKLKSEEGLMDVINDLIKDKRNWSHAALFNPQYKLPRMYYEAAPKPPKEETKEEEVITSFNEDYDEEKAVKQSRLSMHSRTYIEIKYFRKEIKYDLDLKFYFTIRNSILQLWLNKPHTRVKLYQDILRPRRIILAEKVRFAKKIYNFLERFGYINFGIFSWEGLKHHCVNVKNRAHKIAVIGAGIAGLVTARQLTYFGFDVILIEASKRMGGRCYSFYNGDHFIDLGCTFISGEVGNPLHTVLRQLSKSAKKLPSKHKLYMSALEVPKTDNYVIQSIFLFALSFCYYMSLEKQINSVGKLLISVEQMIYLLIALLEMSARSRIQEKRHPIHELYRETSALISKLRYFMDLISDSSQELQALSQPTWNSDGHEKLLEMNFPNINFDAIAKAHLSSTRIDGLEETYNNFMERIRDIIEDDSLFAHTDRFLGIHDVRILHWYMAVMEFQAGVNLSNYSLSAFAKNHFNYSGPQYYCADSYVTILKSLYSYDNTTGKTDLKPKIDTENKNTKMNLKETKNVKGKREQNQKGNQKTEINITPLEVHRNTTVRAIKICSDHVIIKADKEMEHEENQSKSNVCSTSMKVDAVVCTVPLGVLKKSTLPKSEQVEGRIHFYPRLNPEKVSAIQRLGFATINKVCLCFEENFWTERITDEYLGNVTSVGSDSRGEFLFYFNLGSSDDPPTVTSYLCGKAGELSEQVDEVILVSRCYNVLKELMGEPSIARPTKYSVTRWKSNKLFHGTHTYVTDRSRVADVLKVSCPFAFPKSHPRLFFAGEHTSPTFLGTAHGAFLSGLRAASEIANTFDPFGTK